MLQGLETTPKVLEVHSMYSLVMMMAMTGTATDSPALFGKKGNSCCGSSSSCTGYSCSGYACSGSSYGGCTGNSCHGGKGGRRDRHSSCHGGSCYGGGCYGGGYVSACGCCGTVSYGCVGGAMMGAPATTGGEGVKPVDGTRKPGTDAFLSVPATIVVSLPADATLTVDGVVTKSTTGVRRLVTPALPAGETYTYTLEAKVGELVATQTVVVRAGEETAIALNPGKSVVSK